MSEFTLEEAREVLTVLRTLAPDGLRAPFSRADAGAVLAAGVEIKSIEQGLIDFPAVVDGQDAYWCWQAGEDHLGWWHPRDTGFAGRRPILDDGEGGEDSPGRV